MSLLESALPDNLGAQASLPREMSLDIPPAAIDAAQKVVSVLPISSSSVGPNQQIQIQVPARNMMRSGSAYLMFDVIFSGASHAFSFATASASASALFQSMQLSVGGVVLESINNYSHWAGNVVEAHAKNGSYLAEQAICAASFSPEQWKDTETYDGVNHTGYNLLPVAVSQFRTAAAAPNGNRYRFALDLHLGLLNNKHAQAVPLFLFGQGMLLTIMTSPLTRAVSMSDAAATLDSYAIENIQMCYTEITPPQTYVDSVRAGLAQGKMVKIEAESVLNLQVGANSSLQQIYSLNLSSLDAILFGIVRDQDSLATSKFFEGNLQDLNAPELVRNQIYVDGQLIYNSAQQLNIPSQCFRELRKAITGVVAGLDGESLCKQIGKPSEVRTPASRYNGSYLNQAYLRGLSTRKFVSDDVSFPGTRCSTVTLELQNPGVASTSTVQIFFIYSYALTIDASGTVSKVQ